MKNSHFPQLVFRNALGSDGPASGNDHGGQGRLLRIDPTGCHNSDQIFSEGRERVDLTTRNSVSRSGSEENAAKAEEELSYDDGGEELETTAEFQYITNPYNAFNMGKGILERSRRQKTISFVGTPRLLNLTAGDVVTITYSPYNLSSAAYRIETINLLDNGLVSIQALEYFDIYTWSDTPPAENVGEEALIPTGTETAKVTSLAFTDTNASSTGRPFLSTSGASID